MRNSKVKKLSRKNNFMNVNFHRSNNRVFQFGCKSRKLKYRYHYNTKVLGMEIAGKNFFYPTHQNEVGIN